ncbi:MAG: hypothetical protein D9C04_00530 [Nitrosopumilus sp. B06]|nr:MAG: hypothetical protein EB828_06595 [Nitrosopumilus sp. D6]RNJ80659.1 MAG: hypothetical protein D9C04_00530 [Nitrosopumilus sp. B06]
MNIRVRCADKYEAQKLAGLIFVRDSGQTNIMSILNIIENELVMSVRDKSAHSVMLYDASNVEIFADFCQSIFDGEHVLKSTKPSGDIVEMTKD